MAGTYFFRAVASDGKIRTGSLAGNDERTVARELRKQGLTPVYVGPTPKKSSIEIKLPSFGGRRRGDVLFFTQELSTLLNAGVPLDRALTITAELTEHPQFRTIVLDVLRVLKGGRTLADSLGTHGEYFSDLYINMVRAGEASGALAIIFARLAEFERSRDDLRNFIVSAMIYPALLAAVGAASVTILLTFVVPRFAIIFQDGHMKMPTPTRLMLEASDLIKTYGWFAVAALVAGAIIWRVYTRTVAGRLWWDGFKLRIPMFGDVIRKAQSAQFARAMGTLISNGVPLVQTLTISRAIMTNRRMSDALEIVAQGIKRGEGVSTPLTRSGQFPLLLSHLIAVGEETGRLDAMFLRAAEIYDADTRSAIKRFTSLFEPLIILFMGVVIGSLILSLMMAITSLNDVGM